MECQYQTSDGSCGSPIVADEHSYSGYSHSHSADWCHWATIVPYGPQGKDSGNPAMSLVSKLCSLCGQRGSDNEAHIKYEWAGGHKFITTVQ